MTKQTRLTSPETNPTTISITELRAALSGRVIAPDAAGYNEARAVFYGGIDRRPAVIIRVASVAGVSQVVSLARETRLNLAVRSGGHSLAGYSTTDGGIVLDLSDMKALQIDTERRTAWAETGLTAGEYTAEAGTQASPRASARPARSGSGGSRWAAGSDISSASTASRSTTCWPPTS
jgi:hypothetical protein